MQGRYVGVVVAGAAYVALSHWLMTRAPASAWNAVVLIAPMLVAATVCAWQAGQRVVAVCAAGAIVALGVQVAFGAPLPVEWLYLAQHTGVHLLLALWFGSTLRRGQRPLISRIAARVHREMTPQVHRYTRNVTLAWTLYFVGMASVSLLLFASAPFEAWAVFANLLTPLALAAMFGTEHWLRYRLHPEFERVGVLAVIRAYQQPPTAPAPLQSNRAEPSA
jgi:uncharacterized membrane protein